METGEAMLRDALRVALIDMKSDIAVRINRAIERLAEGSYGTCDDCGQDITELRLLAMPFATHCRVCEQMREALERQRPSRHWRIDSAISDERTGG